MKITPICGFRDEKGKFHERLEDAEDANLADALTKLLFPGGVDYGSEGINRHYYGFQIAELMKANIKKIKQLMKSLDKHTEKE